MRTDDKETTVDEPKPRRAPKPKREKRERKEKMPKVRGEFKASLSERLRSRTVIGFIVIIVAILIGFVAIPVVQGIVSERVPVVVAAVDIEKGTYVTQEHFAVSEIGAVDRPSNAAVTLEQVVGSYAGIDIQSGDIITSSKLKSEIPLANPYLYELPDGKVALSITVKGLAEGLTGKLKPNDIVSVYAVFNKSDAEEDYISVQPQEVKYMRVLATSNSAGIDIDVDDIPVLEDKETEKLPATITVMAGDYQAAALAGLDRNATIYVALVARGENTEYCTTLLRTQDEFIEELEKELLEEEGEESEETLPSDESSAIEEASVAETSSTAVEAVESTTVVTESSKEESNG